MGKFTVEKWQCDRCGVIVDKKPSLRVDQSVVVTTDYPYDSAGGISISWKEMCQPCNQQVGREVEAMQKTAKEARAALNTIKGGEK